ncbi:MAG: 23S rRNA (pseudouridine(1915)-N(3))-methyltransferase RlmH [Candidatus Peribacteraceae bacterium]
MQRITLLAVGVPRFPWIREGALCYKERIDHEAQLEIVSLKESTHGDPVAQRDEESGRILDALSGRRGTVIVLDERGEVHTSASFAALVAGARDQGQPLIFVLGGAHGLADGVRQRADRILALSAMTLPHELCQVFFLEQLYRGLQINKGTGYHHAG